MPRPATGYGWRLYALASREAGRAGLAGLRRGLRGPRWRVPKPERLLFAPQDLRTSDATYAQDIQAGLFAFAGRMVETRGRSPFEVTAPSPGWSEALYGFGWLRHHKAADSASARENARALVAEAIGPRSAVLDRGIGRGTRVVARRVISFLCQSPLLLNGADHGFYERFLRAIGRGVVALEADARSARRPLDRLAAATALSYAALCCSGLENRLRRATRLLSAELDAQILTDGGHVTRDPGALVDLLLDLLPLRLLYKSRGIEAPVALGRAVDRMMPMLRYLRHGSGELALFNGMGPTAIDHLATLLSYDAAAAAPPAYAKPSGYARLAAGTTLVFAETGAAPPLAASACAHAGCLSVELSSGPHRIVVNAGAPRADGPARVAGRETASHSTLVLAGASSALVLDERRGILARWLARRLGPVLLAGPRDVPARTDRDPDGWLTCTASHDGYQSQFSVRHERALKLMPDGARLDGEDRLSSGGRRPEAAVRFHLHPTVRVGERDGRSAVALALPGGERWRFQAAGGELAVAESTYYGGADGWRPTLQLVLHAPAVESGGPDPIRWSFERLPEPASPLVKMDERAAEHDPAPAEPSGVTDTPGDVPPAGEP